MTAYEPCKILRKINLLGHSGHLDDNNDILNNIFRFFYPFDLHDLVMTWGDFVNALKMLI